LTVTLVACARILIIQVLVQLFGVWSVVLVGRRLDDHGISSTFRVKWSIANHCDFSQVKEVMTQVKGKWIAWKS
jgi:hypothetical protein